MKGAILLEIDSIIIYTIFAVGCVVSLVTYFGEG
jgi:hypothetical protein